MKYQVSCDVSFVNASDRDAAFMQLWSKKPVGLPGDTLAFGQASGYHTINCLYRFDTESERDAVHNYLSPLNVVKTVPGFVEKHTCNHDTGSPCTDSVIDSWGDS